VTIWDEFVKMWKKSVVVWFKATYYPNIWLRRPWKTTISTYLTCGSGIGRWISQNRTTQKPLNGQVPSVPHHFTFLHTHIIGTKPRHVLHKTKHDDGFITCHPTSGNSSSCSAAKLFSGLTKTVYTNKSLWLTLWTHYVTICHKTIRLWVKPRIWL
jgi:hypothetical protein